MSITKIALLVAVVFTPTLIGCSQPTAEPSDVTSETTTVTLVNKHCPMAGGKASEEVTVEWDGKTVGFCCPMCIDGWNELSEEEKAAKLASAGPESSSDSKHDDHEDASPDAS